MTGRELYEKKYPRGVPWPQLSDTMRHYFKWKARVTSPFPLEQAWVTRATSEDDDFPGANGAP